MASLSLFLPRLSQSCPEVRRFGPRLLKTAIFRKESKRVESPSTDRTTVVIAWPRGPGRAVSQSAHLQNKPHTYLLGHPGDERGHAWESSGLLLALSGGALVTVSKVWVSPTSPQLQKWPPCCPEARAQGVPGRQCCPGSPRGAVLPRAARCATAARPPCLPSGAVDHWRAPKEIHTQEAGERLLRAGES